MSVVTWGGRTIWVFLKLWVTVKSYPKNHLDSLHDPVYYTRYHQLGLSLFKNIKDHNIHLAGHWPLSHKYSSRRHISMIDGRRVHSIMVDSPKSMALRRQISSCFA